MTPRDLENIHTAGNSCRDTFMRNMALKLPFLPADGEASWSLTVRPHNATRKHLFLYTQGDKSGLRKPIRDKHQH